MLKAIAQERRGADPLVTTGALLGLAIAVALGATRFLSPDRNPILDRSEGWALDDGAVLLAIGVPSIVALVGARRRPWLLIAAGLQSALMAVSPLVFTLPLAIPATLFFVASARRGVSGRRQGLAVALVTILGLCPIVILFVWPRHVVCWTYSTRADGRTVFVRDAGTEMSSGRNSFRGTTGPLRSGETAAGGGCTSGAVMPEQSVAMIVFTAAAVFCAVRSSPVASASSGGVGEN